MKTLSVRFANEQDGRLIYEWRNDAHSRRMSHRMDEIDWPDHQIWFKKSLCSKARILLMCENDLAIPVALVRFDLSHVTATISISLNPIMRGKKLAKPCLVACLDFFTIRHPSVTKLIAEIKEVNVARQSIFRCWVS